MRDAEVFFDSNVVLYLISLEQTKAQRAETLVRAGGVISVQVLNEFANVASRKYGASWPAIGRALTLLRRTLDVRPLTIEVHELGLQVAERYRLSFYDSLLIAAALLAGCPTFYSEDLHHGQVIERALTIQNPFRDA